MASSFELLEAYVKISERGATATINRIRQVEAAAVSASQRNVVINISTSLGNVLAQLNQVTAALNQVVGNARILSFSQTNNSLTQTVSLSQQVVNNTNNITNNIQRAGSASGGLNNVLSLLSQATLGYFSLQTAINAVSASFTESFGRERSFITFRQLTGSAEEAKALLEDIEALAQRTPFEFPELRQTAQRLLALGSASSQISNEILMIANVSAGTGAALEQISRVYTQVRSKQQLYAEELQQFGDAGVPLLQELAKNLNTNELGVRKLAEQGKIGFPEVEEAFRTMTSEGGKFANLVTEIGNTTPGLFIRLRTEAVGLGADLASATAGQLNAGLENALTTVRLIRQDVQLAIETFSYWEDVVSTFSDSFGITTRALDIVERTGFMGDRIRDLRDLSEITKTIRVIDSTAQLFTTTLEQAGLAAKDAGDELEDAANRGNARWAGMSRTLNDAADAAKNLQAANRIRESVLTPYEELSDKLREINRLQQQELLAPVIAERAIAKAREDYEKLIQTQDKASESAKRLVEELNADNLSSADRIRESLLTPLEEVEQKIVDINTLRLNSFLDDDTATRAINKAIEDYGKLISRQEKLARGIERSSFTVGTSQAFSVVLQSSNEQRRASQAAEEQARLQKTANDLLQEIRDELDELNNAPPELTEQTFDTTEIF